MFFPGGVCHCNLSLLNVAHFAHPWINTAGGYERSGVLSLPRAITSYGPTGSQGLTPFTPTLQDEQRRLSFKV